MSHEQSKEHSQSLLAMQFFKHTGLSYSEDKLDREPSQEISLKAGTIIDMNIDEIPATHLDEKDVQSIIGDLPNQSLLLN